MTIERIHIEGGYSIMEEKDSLDIARSAIEKNLDNLRSLPEGEYDLTPKEWKRPTLQHNLIVFQDGTGIYRG